MTKDVLVAIKGLQFGEESDTEELETITNGQYFLRNGNHYILYEEVMDGFDGVIRNRMKIKEHELSITKKGAFNVQMVFEENKKNMTNYTTPFGDIMVGIDTQRIHTIETENDIHVTVDYALEINYQHLADCTINIHITPKELSGNFLH